MAMILIWLKINATLYLPSVRSKQLYKEVAQAECNKMYLVEARTSMSAHVMENKSDHRHKSDHNKLNIPIQKEHHIKDLHP